MVRYQLRLGLVVAVAMLAIVAVVAADDTPCRRPDDPNPPPPQGALNHENPQPENYDPECGQEQQGSGRHPTATGAGTAAPSLTSTTEFRMETGPIVQESITLPAPSRVAGGAVDVLPAAEDDGEAIPINTMAPLMEPERLEIGQETARDQFAGPNLDVEDAQAQTASALADNFENAVPAVDDDGWQYDGKTAPRPPPAEELDPSKADRDVPALTADQLLAPQEAAETDAMPIVLNSAGAMPDLEDTEEEVPCATCPGHPDNTCNHHGECRNGTCVCHFGWTGEDCSSRRCPGRPDECSNHGLCINTTCVCDIGWMEDDCSRPWPGCPRPGDDLPECSGIEHGECHHVTGICNCKEPWTEADCSRMKCPGTPECSNHGQCWYGKCVCDHPFVGHDCSLLSCPGALASCDGHGRCDNGTCTCASHWAGNDCSHYECPGDPICSGHGDCHNGICICDGHWKGSDCSLRRCPGEHSDCNDHGVCVDGACHCDPSWTGEDCTIRRCKASGDEQECSGHGTCWHGLCECAEGWTGSDCSNFQCPDDCNKHGVCIDHKCSCEPQYKGDTCGQLRCPTIDSVECSGKGECIRGHCVCRDGWKGTACHTPTCPGYDSADPDMECSNNGQCVNGTCVCETGYGGAACEQKHCAGYPEQECAGHGTCSWSGLCECAANWKGLDCSTRQCPGSPLECSGRGMCLMGKCVCNIEWKGEICDMRRCPAAGANDTECNGRGACVDGQCKCDRDWSGQACEKYERCPGTPDCFEHGECNRETNACQCFPGWKGVDCNTRIGMESECEANSVWSECAPLRPRTCSEPDRQDTACNPGCMCPNSTVWDTETRTCVEVRRCLPEACHADVTPSSDGALVAVATRQCNTSETQNPDLPTDCVCRGERLTVCWGAGEDLLERHANATRVVLALDVKTLDLLRDPDRSTVWLDMPQESFDQLLPVADNASVAQRGVPHMDLGPSRSRDRAFGQVVESALLVPRRTGYHVIRYVIKRTEADMRAFPENNHTLLYAGEALFYVSDCDATACPGENGLECSGNGFCVNGTCQCEEGWTGPDCNRTSCMAGCNHGRCTNWGCHCREGWEGSTCSQRSCPKDDAGRVCSGRGVCQAGECVCNPGFQGSGCDEWVTQPSCEGGAVWTPCGSKCTMLCGQDNTTCRLPSLPWECQAKCACPPNTPHWDTHLRRCVALDACPFYGCNTALRTTRTAVDLAIDTVPCRNKDHKRCVCARAPMAGCWKAGSDFVRSTLDMGTPFGISLHSDDGTFPGKLVARNSTIDLAYEALASLETTSPQLRNLLEAAAGDGSAVGFWDGAKGLNLTDAERAVLERGSVSGDDRLTVPAFGDYILHFWRERPGEDEPEFVTSVEFYAQECPDHHVQRMCPGGNITGRGECNGRGVCVNRTCVCDPGWMGSDCGQAHTCPGFPLVCSGHGLCHGSECSCFTGYQGDDCAQAVCPNDCSAHGACIDGKCVCDEGWAGVSCGSDVHTFTHCAPGEGDECSGHGMCVGGVCVCNYGWHGVLCNVSVCPGWPDECSQRGACHNGTCQCDQGWTGANCNQPACLSQTSEPCSGHGLCANGLCVCFAGFMGDDCGTHKCGGDPLCNSPNGRCENGACVCNDGWKGSACSVRRCPGVDGECNGRGECLADGVCHCLEGWRGHSCEIPKCAGSPECSAHGSCLNGHCQCHPGWTGLDCSSSTCLLPSANHIPCMGRGECDNGTCVCDAEWTGTDCSTPQCPSDVDGRVCGDDGVCVAGACQCRPNVTGIACTVSTCPADCSGNGECMLSVCVCDPNYYGNDCSIRGSFRIPPPPPPIITAHYRRASATSAHLAATNALLETSPGEVVQDQCPRGLVKTDCIPRHMASCARPGRYQKADVCYEGCTCPSGTLWDHVIGACVSPGQCAERREDVCEEGCLQGECRAGQCSCFAGWAGESCDRKLCPLATSENGECNGRGTCNNGTCHCYPGYAGRGCTRLTCQKNCTGRGVCKEGMCDCDHKYTGSACQFLACPIGTNGESCSGIAQGICNATTGHCRCRRTFEGLSCSDKTCPLGCSGNGDCNHTSGTCVCNDGWRGEDCSLLECPNQCSYRGECDDRGACHCFAGFRGLDCSEVECPVGRVAGSSNGTAAEECSGKGRCSQGACICQPGYTGKACSMKYCPRNCTRHGRCIDGACQCIPGRTGPDCSRIICEAGCNGKGVCSPIGECVCDAGWTGPECFQIVCPGDPACSGHGSCVDTPAKCECETGWGGSACDVELPALPPRVMLRPHGTEPSYTPCALPFAFRNATYYDCTTEGIPTADVWCSLDPVFSGRWGVCAPLGTCPGDNGLECSGHGSCGRVDNVEGVYAVCQCHVGWSGPKCEEQVVRVVGEDEVDAGSTGALCHLPFTYQNKIYHDCTTEYTVEGREWCALDSKYTSERWGYCAPRGTCPGESECSNHGDCDGRGKCNCHSGWVGADCSKHVIRVTSGTVENPPGQLCAFPFEFDGKEYHNCTTDPTGLGEPWCMLDAGEFKNGVTRWDFCAPQGTCPGDPECSGQGQCVNGTCICGLGYQSFNCSVPMDELDVLKAFYAGTNGNDWTNNDGWLDTRNDNYCSWYGVTCDSNNRVHELQLPGNNLQGTISKHLAMLTSLVNLDLSSNRLTGAIPKEFGKFVRVETINLANNQLNGNLPEELLDMDSAQRVNVDENFLVAEDYVVVHLEHRLSSSFTCDGNCIRHQTCRTRLEGCGAPQDEPLPFQPLLTDDYDEAIGTRVSFVGKGTGR